MSAAAEAAVGSELTRCPVTGVRLQYGQCIAPQWYWDDETQKAVYGDMAVPQAVRHQPTLAFVNWLKSIFYDRNRTMTAERRDVIQRALREGKFVDTNDLAVVASGENAVLMNYHHRGSEIQKFIEFGGKLHTAITVLYGIDFANIRFFDTGKNRSTIQIAKIMQEEIPQRSIPLINVMFEMLGETKLLSPDERILAAQAITPEINAVRNMLGADKRLRQPVVEAAFVSAYCHIEGEEDADAKIGRLAALAEAMQENFADYEDDTDEETVAAAGDGSGGSADEAAADDTTTLAAIAINNRIALFERGKKNGIERQTAFYLVQQGIYRYMNGERFAQLRPKVRGYSPQYALPAKISEVTNIKSKFEEDEETAKAGA